MTTAAFSTNDDVILRKVECESKATVDKDLVKIYELKECIDWISRNNFNHVSRLSLFNYNELIIFTVTVY